VFLENVDYSTIRTVDLEKTRDQVFTHDRILVPIIQRSSVLLPSPKGFDLPREVPNKEPQNIEPIPPLFDEQTFRKSGQEKK